MAPPQLRDNGEANNTRGQYTNSSKGTVQAPTRHGSRAQGANDAYALTLSLLGVHLVLRPAKVEARGGGTGVRMGQRGRVRRERRPGGCDARVEAGSGRKDDERGKHCGRHRDLEEGSSLKRLAFRYETSSAEAPNGREARGTRRG